MEKQSIDGKKIEKNLNSISPYYYILIIDYLLD